MSIPPSTTKFTHLDINSMGQTIMREFNGRNLFIIQCILSYCYGDEGATPIDITNEINVYITSIIQDSTTKEKNKYLLDLINGREYFENEHPNKKEFCMYMKCSYGATYGQSINTYKFLSLYMHKHPEGNEGNEGNINNDSEVTPGVFVWKPNKM
eukprot:76862_1